MNVCHVYPYETADGPANMALDEAMLEAVGPESRSAASADVRLVGADAQPGLLSAVGRGASRSALMRVPIVRRPTGGGAIWHHHEVTYALAVPERHALARPSTRLYRAVHGAISGGLVGLGIQAVRRGEVFSPEDCERSRPLLCFTDRSPEDIVFEGIKIVGSASVGAGGLSSNMDPFYWLDRLGRPS